jgi:twitching motility protein PilT
MATATAGGAQGAEWLDPLLARAAEEGASDVHLVTGEPPWVRVQGEVAPVGDARRLGRADIEAVIARLASEEKRADFAAGREIDLSYALAGGPRFRVSAFGERRGPAVAFRFLAGEPPALAELGLPQDLLRAIYARGGLVLFAGHAGAGKTTTLAAVLAELCRRRTARLITLEDPIEFRLEARRGFVEQREVGRHCRSFEAGVREAIEAAPDVIAIGELRDLETIRLALQAAETGILVFATVHAYDATRTIGRLVDAFPPEERAAARFSLAGTLRMIAAQTLLRRARGPGRVPAVEVCHGGTSLSTLVREGKEHELASVLESGRSRGMRTLDDSLVQLVRTAQVTPEEALFFAVHKENVAHLIEAA